MADGDPLNSLFERSLGDAWHQLPASIQRLHSVATAEQFQGTATVVRGRGLLARLIALVFGFPKAGTGIPVTIAIRSDSQGEWWHRTFAGLSFQSRLTPSPHPGHIRERFMIFTFELGLPVEDATLGFIVRRGWVLGLPLPVWLLPGSQTLEFDKDGTFHFDVGLYAPLNGGLIVRYQGTFDVGPAPKTIEDIRNAP